MKAINSSYDLEKTAPDFRITDHGWFLSVTISSKNTYPTVTFHIGNKQELVNFKNRFLSAYEKLMKEAKDG